ncbi:MAG: MlaD family protein, partial [Nocardioides sp.]
MNRVWQNVSGRALAVATAVILLAATFFVVRGDDEVRTVTAHFPRAVSVYEGSEVRILGVKVGRVTAVVPEGNSVRVEMEYDAEEQIPADAKAAVITPTLVADRFVQLTPAYTGGPVMQDGADIALPDSGVPVEL